TGEISISAVEIQSEPSTYLPITPEVKRPYPTAVRNIKTNKGREPDKSCIYSTPEKTKLEERHRQKELKKKLEHEREARTKAVRRSLKELNSRQKKKKAKKIECDEDSEGSEGSRFSLWESSTSPVDLEINVETEDRSINYNLNMTTVKINGNCYVLIKFEKETYVVHYIGKVLSHYSSTELKTSYLRKKPGLLWSFFLPDIKDIHTVYISDIAMILPDSQPRAACTPRMNRLFIFAVN
ncbi:hypothetical protein HHI36_009326, partial [Cryptolaemus montrouzieri]